ncbi:hypothetical protein GPJ56_003962 [Histomonas meleagridis]|uniref:uncharacterized protein n=1 Tax=Histomonas meleagridis TaxID=135588 RepID=UPI00355A6764|nr:hypothetical protein GPJ56_003962 [Histomonas meleagridis]KAH0798103.1 hypothetical protein GO595_009114 [Histomonas meleagridis]
MCEIQTFWGVSIPAGKKVELQIPDNLYTIVTNICLGEITKQEPTKVKLYLETILIDEIDEAKQEAPTEKHETVLTILIPNQFEQFPTNQIYSPLNKVYIEADGPNTIYISGYYDDIEDDAEEEEEEIIEGNIDEILMNKKLE